MLWLKAFKELQLHSALFTADVEAARRFPKIKGKLQTSDQPGTLALLLNEPLRYLSPLEVYAFSRLHRTWEVRHLDLLLVAIHLDDPQKVKAVRSEDWLGPPLKRYQEFFMRRQRLDDRAIKGGTELLASKRRAILYYNDVCEHVCIEIAKIRSSRAEQQQGGTHLLSAPVRGDAAGEAVTSVASLELEPSVSSRAGTGGDDQSGSSPCSSSLKDGDAADAPDVAGKQHKLGAKAPKVCSNCGRSGGGGAVKLKVCQGCRAAWYCNVSCQAANWQQHQAVCAAGNPQQAA